MVSHCVGVATTSITTKAVSGKERLVNEYGRAHSKEDLPNTQETERSGAEAELPSSEDALLGADGVRLARLLEGIIQDLPCIVKYRILLIAWHTSVQLSY